jgi:hypothetical protein
MAWHQQHTHQLPTDCEVHCIAGFPAPVNQKGDVGFDVTIFDHHSSNADISLASEVGDVMYRMEYPDAAITEGSAAGLSYSAHAKEGGAADYSFKVDGLYEKRRENGAGQNAKNNPYPTVK